MASPACSTEHMLACPEYQTIQSAKKDTKTNGAKALTTTSFGLACVTRLSSQYSQPPLEAIKAVSK